MTNLMKPSTIKCWLTCIFLCAAFLTSGQLIKVDSLIQEESYNLAALECERLVFNSNDPIITNKALLLKSQIYKKQNKHKEALNTVKRANYFIQQDSLNFSLRYEWVINAYLAGQFSEAVAQLVQIEYYFKENRYPEVLYLHVLSLNELRKWEEAKEKYESYGEFNDLELKPNEAYKFIGKTKIKDLEKAQKLALFPFGISEFYAGYIGRGIIASAVQATLLGYGVYSFQNGYIFSGAFTSVGLYWLLYNGSPQLAKDLAERKNIKLTEKYNKPIRQAILEIETKKLR